MSVTAIHAAIQKVWLENIPRDYANGFLRHEDSLKNAFYFHLRTALGDAFLVQNHLRVYTEYHYGSAERPRDRADLAVVQVDDSGALDVLAVVEFKYKAPGVDERHYYKDVQKTFEYFVSGMFPNAHFYVAFLNETDYGRLDPEERSYVSDKQRAAAVGRLTELLGYQEDETSTWYCIEH